MDYTLVLEGKNEFYPNLNNKTYNILLVDNKKKIKYMINYFKKFIELQNKNTKEKFYLDFKSDGFGKVPIDEPIGYSNTFFELKQKHIPDIS